MVDWEKQVKVSLDDIFDVENEESDSVDDFPIEDVVEDDDSQSSHFTDVEVEDIVSRGIILILAEEYHGKTGKKPIWKNRITNPFKKWLKDNYPEVEEIEKALPTLKDNKEKRRMTGSELSKAMDYFHHIKFLYELFGTDKIEVVKDFSDEEIEHIEKIDKLIKGE